VALVILLTTRLTYFDGRHKMTKCTVDKAYLESLEKLYRSVLVEDRGHDRVTYHLDQLACDEALHAIVATSQDNIEMVTPLQKRDLYEWSSGSDYPSESSYQEGLIDGWNEAVDAINKEQSGD